MGLLVLAVFGLSLVQYWLVYTAPDVMGYGVVHAGEGGMPPPDKRGAFLIVNEANNPLTPGSAIELLPTTQPGVVDTQLGAHLLPHQLKAVLVQVAVAGEPGEYRVYRYLEETQQEMKVIRQPGGRGVMIQPKDGAWQPGTYIVDVPAEGMFGGGRTYYQFYLDEP